MLVLPVDEDAWGFRLCLLVGLALLALDVVLPRVFRRRVRLQWPRLPWRVPRQLALPRARPLAHDAFRRRKREIERELRALERGGDGNAATDASATDGDGTATDAGCEKRSKDGAKKKTKKKTRSRVVLPGDRTEIEGEQSEAQARRRRLAKRVSFGTTRQDPPPPSRRTYDDDDDREETKDGEHNHEVAEAAARPRARLAVTEISAPKAAISADGTAQRASDPAPAPPQLPTSRPDPFSLVDDDFPWQLPNYARASMATAPSTSVAPPPSVAPQAAPLNIRRPLGHVNAPSVSASSSVSMHASATGSLELKHKPFWKRSPAKERDPSPANKSIRNSPVIPSAAPAPIAASAPAVPADSSFGRSSFASSTVLSASNANDSAQLLFRPDPALRPSPVPMRNPSNPFFPKSWRVPSPKPPLHTRPAAPAAAAPSAAASTSHISTPVAPQSRLRTPKIIRRITFDEDMMGALATPSDASPLITETARKRQRENDVHEALDAVGLPWHKRRL